jgi:type II secretory pathway component PulL
VTAIETPLAGFTEFTVSVYVVGRALKLAVTVALAFMVMVQVTVVAVAHPVQEAKALPPETAGAVRVTTVPAL